ncbi:MAG: hypothetical protein ACREFJ_13705, partial [Acetobacteraceae bacterium]
MLPEQQRLAREQDRDAVAALDRAGEPERPPEIAPPSLRRKGRGATLNPPVRFESRAVEVFDDGWSLPGEAESPPSLATTLIRDKSRSAIAWNESPD